VNKRPAWLLLSACVLGCGGAQVLPPPPPPPPVDIPEWVNRVPRKDGQICATGAVDPTFYRQDGRTQAAETARGELARTVQVQVTAVMYDEQTKEGSYVDQAIVTEVIGSISEAVISGAEVVSYWFDEYGNVSRKGMTYALACMRTDQSVAQLAEKLKEAFPEKENEAKIEAVKERAEAAFEELEKAEEAQQQAPAPPVVQTDVPPTEGP
jgi:hypothetical protein